jgi:hypothetical protein
MNFRLTSAWALLLAVAIGLAAPRIAETRTYSEDRNRDGRADVWQYYDGEGDRVTVLRDRNFDGYVDVREVLDGHRVVSRALDQNFDHRFDPSITHRIVYEREDTSDAATPPFLLPRALFIGDHPLDDRAPVTLDPVSSRRSIANPSGRAPPAAL